MFRDTGPLECMTTPTELEVFNVASEQVVMRFVMVAAVGGCDGVQSMLVQGVECTVFLRSTSAVKVDAAMIRFCGSLWLTATCTLFRSRLTSVGPYVSSAAILCSHSALLTLLALRGLLHVQVLFLPLGQRVQICLKPRKADSGHILHLCGLLGTRVFSGAASGLRTAPSTIVTMSLRRCNP